MVSSAVPLAVFASTTEMHTSFTNSCLHTAARAQREQAETRKREAALRERAATKQLESAAVGRALKAATTVCGPPALLLRPVRPRYHE